MRTSWDAIYRRELAKARDLATTEDLSDKAIERIAEEEAERIYWELVDYGRQQAKDRDR